jgi:ligand-binding sensor protein
MQPKIIDHFDFQRLNILLKGFNQTTGFVTAILDLDGNILSRSGWRQICNEFHRVNENTNKNCKISDTELASQMEKGKSYHAYKCINGLVDVVVPIIIKGEHIANLFSGQFFFEKPDVSFFKKQAKINNFNE